MADIIGSNLTDDLLNGSNGDDNIFGDAVNGSVYRVFPPVDQPDLLATGNDTILAGAGDDYINGDAFSWVQTLTDPSSLVLPALGSDLIKGGSGDDVIHGGYEEFAFHFTGVLPLDFVPTWTPNPVGVFIDQIYGGRGDDFMAGFIKAPDLFFEGNSDTALGGAVGHFSNYLNGGSGDDTMIGQCPFFSEILMDNASYHDSVTSFDGNVMEGGRGDDTMYGNSLVFTMSLSDSSSMYNHGLTLGHDTMKGGADDDVMHGDLGSLVISTDAGTTFHDNYVTVGGDIMKGNRGDDVIYGDIADIDLTGADAQTIDISASAGDDINGGKGDDVIHGQWGDDVLTGGIGDDVFVYDGNIDNGHDVIMDFDVDDDSLDATNGVTLSDGGLVGGNLVIDVSSGGTITLMGVTDYDDVSIS